MNSKNPIEEARELMHKLNHGVGRGKSITPYETKLTEDVDDNPLGVECTEYDPLTIGHVGPASPCCDAEGDKHETHCVMFERDDDDASSA